MLGQQVLRMWAKATGLCRVSPQALPASWKGWARSGFHDAPGDLTHVD